MLLQFRLMISNVVFLVTFLLPRGLLRGPARRNTPGHGPKAAHANRGSNFRNSRFARIQRDQRPGTRHEALDEHDSY